MMHGNLKKILAGLLSAVMVFTAVPVSASAAESVDVADETLEEVSDENQTETVEVPEENSGGERSSVSNDAQTEEEEDSSSSAVDEQASRREESSEPTTEQTENQTVTEPLTEDKTDISEDSEDITQTETTVESMIAEESTEDVTEESETETETETETEEETAEDGISLNASGSGVAEKLNSVLANYPQGKYWNIVNGHAGVNDTPCPTHANINTCIKFPDRYYSSVTQCWAFANMIYSTVFGEFPDWKNGRRIDKDGIKVGDYVRFGDDGYNGHSFVVIEKGNGHNVKVAECNWGGNCKINYRWTDLDGYFYYNGQNRYFSYYCSASNYDEIDNPIPPFDRQKGTYMNTGYSRVIPDGYYHIASSLGDNWWLTIAGMSNDNGANVQLYDYSIRDFECDEQLFYFQFIDEGGGRGFYKITSKQSGKCLDVTNASEYLYDENRNPTNVQQYEDNGSSAQQWAVREVDGGDKGILYTFQARCSGYCLDLWGASTENNANINLWIDNGTPAQQWRLVSWAPVKPKMEPPTAPYPDGAEVEAGTRFYLDTHGADEVYFTWDGTTPTKQSMKYSDFKLSGLAIFTQWKSYTLKAFAVKEGYQDSDIVTYTYTVKPEKPENPSDEESSSNEEIAPEEDIEDGVKWHYNETKVTYKDLSQSGARITTNIKSKVYDGTPYKPAIKVTIVENGKTVTLTEGTDYRVVYSNNIHAGTGSVTVKGNGIYKGEISKNFEITKKPCNKLKVVTGGMIVGDTSEPKVYVYDASTLLTKGKDYVLEGTGAELTATKGSKKIYIVAAPSSDYKDSVTTSLMVYAAGSRVKGIIDNPDMIKLSQGTYQYTGKVCRPGVTVTVDGYTLKANKDYSVKYRNNTNVGTASVTVSGKGEYVGSIVKEFIIAPPPADDGFALKKPIKDVVYNGKLQKPKITVMSGGRTLKLNRDYTVSYNNNLHATDSARIIVRGKGNYASMPAKVFKFKIAPRHINKVFVKGKQGSLILTYAKHTLVESVDYDIIYGDTVGKGKISVTIKAKDGSSFTGEMNKKVKK